MTNEILEETKSTNVDRMFSSIQNINEIGCRLTALLEKVSGGQPIPCSNSKEPEPDLNIKYLLNSGPNLIEETLSSIHNKLGELEEILTS